VGDNAAMADHTIVNLREIEDAAAKHGMPPGLQSRFARSALGLEKSGVTLFTLAPDYKLPFAHRHRDQEEVYLVLRGAATVLFEDGAAELGAWDAIRIPPAVARTLRAGPDGAEVLAFGAGEQGDAEMVEGVG
jgi:mannose-6-phosphate isomerase-like protein (cupin superfamily)